MLRSFARCLALMLGAVLCVCDVVKSQEEPPQGEPGASSMLATRRFLFVVHHGVLHQFDINTLKLLKMVRLGEPAAPVAEPPPPEPVATAPVRRPAAREPEVIVPPAAMSKMAANAVTCLVRHQDEAVELRRRALDGAVPPRRATEARLEGRDDGADVRARHLVLRRRRDGAERGDLHGRGIGERSPCRFDAVLDEVATPLAPWRHPGAGDDDIVRRGHAASLHIQIVYSCSSSS